MIQVPEKASQGGPITCNPKTQQAGVVENLEFKTSLRFIARPCLETIKAKDIATDVNVCPAVQDPRSMPTL